MWPACVCVIILNWQRPQDTIACAQSVEASILTTSVNLRLVIVDNGSKDSSVQQISEACPEADMLVLEKNLGYTGGNNAGISYALENGADMVFLLNNDTIIEPNAISELMKHLEGESAWAITVPKILYYDDPSHIWAAGARWRQFPPRVTMTGFDKKDAPQYNYIRELNYATGCALMVKRVVFKDIGGFDPLFTNYQEDYDFCYRSRQAGYRLLYVPQAVVMHKVSRSLGQDAPERWHYLGRNTVLFYRPSKRFSWTSLLSFLGWVMFRELVNGNGSHLPAFWRGVRDGFTVLQQAGGQTR